MSLPGSINFLGQSRSAALPKRHNMDLLAPLDLDYLGWIEQESDANF